jgi:hypothetical protein
MKRNIMIAILGLTTVFATSSFTDAGSATSSDNMIRTSSKPGTLNAPLDGKWSGGFYNNFGPAYHLALIFDPNGSLTVEHAGSVGYGTYSVVGGRLEATYTIDDIEPQMGRSENDGDTYSLNGNVSGTNISGTLSGSGGSWMFSVTQE